VRGNGVTERLEVSPGLEQSECGVWVPKDRLLASFGPTENDPSSAFLVDELKAPADSDREGRHEALA
jgi:hypothetical protein